MEGAGGYVFVVVVNDVADDVGAGAGVATFFVFLGGEPRFMASLSRVKV